MLKRYLSLLLCTVLSGSLLAHKQPTTPTPLAQEAWSLYNPLRQWSAGSSLHNPALRYYLPQPTLTLVQLTAYSQRAQQVRVQQLGDRHRFFSLEAQSLIPLSSSTLVWGGASYHKGKKTSIRFNNTSDAQLLYPYLLADDKGGFMDYETYQFQGGYLHHFSAAYTLGVELDYRAKVAYRDKDPRPKNTVSDLAFRLGGSKEISSYTLGLAGYLQKYQQDNDIQFVSELNVRPIYHLSGLGMRAIRFDGSSYRTQYDAWGYGGALAFQSQQAEGWKAELTYGVFEFDKLLNDLNDLTLQSLKEQKASGLLAYQERRWAVQASAQWKKRSGTENLFGTAEGGHYPVIGKEKPYQHQVQEVQLRGIWKLAQGQTELYLSPSLSYRQSKESYKDPQRYLKRSSLMPSLSSYLRHATAQAGIFSLEAGIRGNFKLSASSRMDELASSAVLYPLMQEARQLLVQKEIAGLAAIRWDLPFRLFQSTELFLQADWETLSLSHYKPLHQAQLTLGFLF